MPSIGEKIKELRQINGLTQKKFAEKCNLAPGTVHQYESGKRQPSYDALKKIMEAFNLPDNFIQENSPKKTVSYSHNLIKSLNKIINTESLVDTLMETHKESLLTQNEYDHIKKYRTLDSHGKEVVDVVLDKETERMQTLAQQAEDEDDEDDVIDVDFASLKASAGNGFQLFDDCPSDKLKVLYNEKTRQADICIQVSGHSMEPVFNDGDILLVRKQPSVNIGEYGIWIINGDTGYVKKNGPDRLISVNDEYDDIYPGEFDEIRCYGKVIGVLDKNWIVE